MKRRLALLLCSCNNNFSDGVRHFQPEGGRELLRPPQTQEAKAETEKAETTEEAEEAEMKKLSRKTGGYAVQPRSIKDRTLKVGLIPVTMNTAYTMTINGSQETD